MKCEMYDIWKLQRPFIGTDTEGGILAYTYNEVEMSLIPATEDEIKEIFGDKFKVYVAAEIVDGQLIIKDFLEDQEW